jgi:ABC-type uncharacterized transport system involved in gliding motility auxiliary subunit
MRKLVRVFLILLSLCLFLLSIGSWLTLGEYFEYNLGLTAVFLLVLSGYIIFDRARFKKIYEGTFFKNLINASVGVFLIFGILGLVNYLAFKNPYYKDLTSNDRNSLTEQTKTIVKEAPMGLKIISISDKQHIPALRALLELYRYENKNLELEYYDGALRPDLVSKYMITKSPVLVISYEDRQNIIDEVNELNLTNAILKVTKGRTITLGWVLNHGELDIDDEDKLGGSYIRNLAKGSNFTIEKVDLLRNEKIKDDIDVLMVLGPRDDYSPEETKKISDFLKRGGALFIALGPKLEDNFKVQSNLTKLLVDYGIDLLPGAIIDNKSFVSGSNGLVPLIAAVDGNHIITKNFKGQFFLPLAQGMSFNDKVDPSFEHSFLLQSSDAPHAWLEKSADQIRANHPIYNDGVDVTGPIAMAVSLKDSSSTMRIVAIGNSSFLQNSYRNMSGHFLFFLNSLNWLASDEGLISFNIPILDQEPIFVGNTELGLIFYFSVIFMPVLLIALAFYFFQKRRRFS